MEHRYEQYGHKRLAVGSGYGTMDFIAQRTTAIILSSYLHKNRLRLLDKPVHFYLVWWISYR